MGTTHLRGPATQWPDRLRLRRAARWAVVAVVGLVALGITLVGPGPEPARAASYARFYANFAGEELMRAINADRSAKGLAAFRADATLESIARDRSLTCPSNAGLAIRGRARDMADRSYLGHAVPGCTDATGGTFDSFDVLKQAGYAYRAAAENIGENNFPSSVATYSLGCAPGGGACHGSTSLPWTVAVVARSFMDSAGHRANLLSTGYDRFGCGAWQSSAGMNYYSCYFASGGNGVVDASGPTLGHPSGSGATFAVGSRPTLSIGVSDGASSLSDGWASIDGTRVLSWAWDHTGRSATVSLVAPKLAAGRHTLTWWVRDASSRSRSVSLTFTIGATRPAEPPRPPAATHHVSPSAPATAGPSPSSDSSMPPATDAAASLDATDEPATSTAGALVAASPMPRAGREAGPSGDRVVEADVVPPALWLLLALSAGGALVVAPIRGRLVGVARPVGRWLASRRRLR